MTTAPSSETHVTAHVETSVTDPACLIFSVAVAADTPTEAEHLSVTVDGANIPVDEVLTPTGTRLHRVDAPTGELVLDYSATVTASAPTPPVTSFDEIVWRRPSRYAESDSLGILAKKLFTGLEGQALINGVTDWVHEHVLYVSGSSGPTDGATDTFFALEGVCRDFAHLTVALLRGCGLPARLVSVYAPGLVPMDFHAVAEVALDGRWQCVDATRMVPRGSLVRIATGRDGADTAFMTTISGGSTFRQMAVTCYAEGGLPIESAHDVVELGALAGCEVAA